MNAFKGMEASRKDYALISQKLLFFFSEYIMTGAKMKEKSDPDYGIVNEVSMLGHIRKFTKYMKYSLTYIWDTLKKDKRQEYFAFNRKKKKLAHGINNKKVYINKLNQQEEYETLIAVQGSRPLIGLGEFSSNKKDFKINFDYYIEK